VGSGVREAEQTEHARTNDIAGDSAASVQPHMRTLTATEIVTELLRTYQDVTATLNGAGDWIGRGPGARYLDRPANHPYHAGSYRTLEQILVDMRACVPSLYRAVADTYIRGTRRIVEVRVTRKAKNNKTVTVVERRSVPVLNVSQEELDAGVAWITGEFQRRSLSHFLPREVYEAVSA
jgi:hypothetical protein